MFFHEVPEHCSAWPGESIWKAVEYQPAGHVAALQLCNFPPSLAEPLPSLQLTKEERDGHMQLGMFLLCPCLQLCLQAVAYQSLGLIQFMQLSLELG